MIRNFIVLILVLGFSRFLYSQDASEIRLVKFEPSECQDEYHVYKLNNRIVSLEKHSDTTLIEISVKANCCISMNPKIKVLSDTINLIYDFYEPKLREENGDTSLIIVQEECDCECCFSFKYYLTGLGDKNYVYRTKNETLEFSRHKYNIVQEPMFKVVNGDTLNYVDIYGMKQGLHKIYDKQNREVSSLTFQNDLPVSGLTLRTFSETGKIEKECYWLSDTLYRVILFDLKGIAIKECITPVFFDIDETRCKDID